MAGFNIYELQAHIQQMDKVLEDKKTKENKELNIEEIRVTKYMSEGDKTQNAYKVIEEVLMQKIMALVVAPMRCGKSTFSFEELYPVLSGCNYHFIFVSPQTSLLKQVGEEYNVNSCYGGTSANITHLPIICTPDSMYKVVDALEEAVIELEKIGKPFIIVYDEFHVAELNYRFRHKLMRPLNYYDHPLCKGFIGLTATPDNVIKSMEWDRIYRFIPSEMFQQTKHTQLETGIGTSVNDIACHILKTYKNNNYDFPIIARVNDKKKIKAVKEILTKAGLKDVNTWYRDNTNEKDNELFIEMLNRTRCDFNVLLVTSLVDCGVELYPMRTPIIIDFMDFNSKVIDDIQFVGRFREGVKQVRLVLPPYEEQEIGFKSYEEVAQYHYETITEVKEMFSNKYSKIEVRCDGLRVEYDELNGIYSYEIDKHAVDSMIFNDYIRQFTRDRDRLKEYLENHFTYNSEIITCKHYAEDYTELEDIKEYVEEAKAEAKAIKEQFKEEREEFVEWVKDVDDLTFNVLRTKPDDITINDKWVLEEIEEYYSFYWSHDMLKDREHFYSILPYEKQGYTQKELLLKALDTKWYNNFKKQKRYTESNYFFDNKKKVRELDAQLRKTKVLVYTIRQSILNMKGSEIGVTLSKKFTNELYELCSTKKAFKDITLKSFEKHLGLIYNISTDRSKAITSIKTKIIFD